MANYFIIGGDGKEYGPITDADVRQWINESRLNSQTQAKAESDAEFRLLAQFPEFAEALAANAPAPIRPLPSSAPADILQRDYELDLGGCISRGWELVKNNMSVLLVGTLVYLLIQGAMGGLQQIPIVGMLVAAANFVISGPLMAGVLYLFLRSIRGEPAEIGNIFDGFRRGFGQLFLGTLVQGLLIGLCLVPFIVMFIIKIIPLAGHLQHLQQGTPPDQATINALKSILFTTLPVGFICAIPATYLGVCWKFTLPLIIDRQLDFWTAMKTSFKMVNKHWWQIFGLIMLVGLVNIAGVLACCIGLVFTIPIGFAAMMYAYETIFGAKKN